MGSIVFLLIVFCNWWMEDRNLIIAELLLVIVLAAEGVFAIFHLWDSKSARQSESLREFAKEFAHKDTISEREELFTKLPWNLGYVEPTYMLDWKSEWNAEFKCPAYNCLQFASVVIKVTAQDANWVKIQCLANQYHFAGVSCRRHYLAKEDILQWMGPQACVWWLRFGNLILQERDRRKNPGLFNGWQHLAFEAKVYQEKEYPNLQSTELLPQLPA
jgi:hypothetical protein